MLGDDRILGIRGLQVPRPHAFGISTSSDAAFAVFAAAVFVLFAIALVGLRTSRWGRRLVALRDSELAAATVGLPVRRTKVTVFSAAAFMAGCAGALFGGLEGAVNGTQFEPVNSLVIVLFAFVGGITTISGAAIAGALFAVLGYTQATYPDLSGLVFVGIAAAAISLGRQPHGLAGLAISAGHRVRDAWGAGSEYHASSWGCGASGRSSDLGMSSGGRQRSASGSCSWSEPRWCAPARPTRKTRRPPAPTAVGAFEGTAQASGLRAVYNPEGILPIPPPVDLSAPDALATIASGPSTFARASVADPGDLLANPDALLVQASPSYPAGAIPPVPLPHLCRQRQRAAERSTHARARASRRASPRRTTAPRQRPARPRPPRRRSRPWVRPALMPPPTPMVPRSR